MDAYRKPDPERLREQEELAAEETQLRELEQQAEEERRRGERVGEDRLCEVEKERQRRERVWEERLREREAEPEVERRRRRAAWTSTWAAPLVCAYWMLGGTVVAGVLMWPGMGRASRVVIMGLFIVGFIGLCVWAARRVASDKDD